MATPKLPHSIEVMAQARMSYHVRSNIKLWLKGTLILKIIIRDLVKPVCQKLDIWTRDSTSIAKLAKFLISDIKLV
ncbi:MAG: hypothetical protein PF690_05090 [Deltaproteobacteria bacterium]|jgi:hypothetical protein|nr:hypothetical protein [Deltaproteobacteria bacterium]